MISVCRAGLKPASEMNESSTPETKTLRLLLGILGIVSLVFVLGLHETLPALVLPGVCLYLWGKIDSPRGRFANAGFILALISFALWLMFLLTARHII